ISLLRWLELPDLDLVYREASDLDRAVLPKNRERALQIGRTRRCRCFDHSQSTRPELQNHDRGILRLDSGERGSRPSENRIHVSQHPLEQIEMMTRLVA